MSAARRFGLGWRAELGAGILANLERIDAVEVMAEDFFEATKAEQRALRFLKTQVPVVLHATSLGLASPERVDRGRLERIARVIGWLEPELWSEHLAFVRGGGLEVGHLAAPPRNDATLEGLVRNVGFAHRATGSLPLLENVASLVEPPLSSYDECAWLHAVLAATPCDLLLDLHNVHANATNFGFSAAALVRSLPASRIRMLHLAGGRRIEGDRILDDHLHEVPDAVFELLSLVDADATVILERDGRYPPIEELLAELDHARASQWGGGLQPSDALAGNVSCGQPIASARSAEARGSTGGEVAFLAAIYTDTNTRARFLADPVAAATAAGFSREDAEALSEIDRENLALAARGFAHKRARRHVSG